MIEMPEILLPIKPRWCEKIFTGEKIFEIRKTRPKYKPPFKCYIYCTKGENLYLGDGHEIECEESATGKSCYHYLANGKVIGEFVCDEIVHIESRGTRYITAFGEAETNRIARESRLDFGDMQKYLGSKDGFAWHISDLVIYDKPKELYDFYKICDDPYQYCQGCKFGQIVYPESVETYEDVAGCCFETRCHNIVRKAPQSWMYVWSGEK